MLGQKSTLGKFNKIEVISNIFSSHNAMRLEINCKKTVKNNNNNNKTPNTWRLNNMLLSNQRTTEEIKEAIKNYLHEKQLYFNFKS